MAFLLTDKEMKEADTYTSDVIGIPSLVLMERAALATAQEIMKRFQPEVPVLVFSGRGNNGADGLAAGRILLDAGYTVFFYVLPGKVAEGSSFEVQENILRQYGVSVVRADEAERDEALRFALARPVVIDALFGTGLDRDLTGDAQGCVWLINKLHSKGAFVVSVDIASGVSAADGSILGKAVDSDRTVTFAFYKRGHFLYPGCTKCGEVVRHEIGITDRSFQAVPEMFTYLTETAKDLLPAREEAGNKATFGKVLVVAGSRNMAGAAVLCALSCARSGAGMVKVMTPACNREILQSALPEAMLSCFADSKEAYELLQKDIDWADTIVCGPGIGTGEDTIVIVKDLLKLLGEKHKAKGLVLDADALNIIAKDSEAAALLRSRNEELTCILTPHPGELARLTGKGAGNSFSERLFLLKEIAEKLRCTVIGKDARSAIVSYDTDRIYLNTSGNSALSTAGSGDVLAGAAAAFLSRIHDPFEAAAVSAYLHGAAGRKASESRTESGVIAGDIIDALAGMLI